MADNERITVRVSQEMAKKIQQLVDNKEYKNTSEIIRIALERLLEEEVSPPNIERIAVTLPKGSVVKLEELVHGGDAVSINDAIREAVREYTRSRFEELIREYQEMQKMKKTKQ